jgi:uncharacterized protein
MSDHEFEIRVSDLDAGGKDFGFPVRLAWIRSALEDCEASAGQHEGKVTVRASKSGTDVVVHGAIDAELSVPCARCLDPVVLPIHADLSVIYVPKAKLRDETGGEADSEGAEADTLPYDGETVVLDDLVRDELLLEIPMIPLCSDDCPGMSPAPGNQEQAKPGIDPRLAPLLSFQAKTKKD